MRFLPAFLILMSFAANAAVLSQNDVSILLPFSTSGEGMPLRADTPGGFGPLLPLEVYDRMPRLAFAPPEKTYSSLRVVGIRLDPCFLKTTSPDSCQPQVRMTWQPLENNAAGKFSFVDAAVHTLYDVPPADFRELIHALENLKTRFGLKQADEPLNVHPMLKKFGFASPYAHELFSLILARVGAARLGQTTFMRLANDESIWVFGGLLRVGSELRSLAIPRIPRPLQFFVNRSPDGSDFRGGIGPAPEGADNFNLIISRTGDIQPTDEAEIVEGTLSAFRIENPSRHNAQTADCVSCHTAQIARIWSAKKYPDLKLNERGGEFRYRSRYDLTNVSPTAGDTRLLRAFGYDKEIPAINQRTVNETAAVLEKLYGSQSPK